MAHKSMKMCSGSGVIRELYIKTTKAPHTAWPKSERQVITCGKAGLAGVRAHSKAGNGAPTGEDSLSAPQDVKTQSYDPAGPPLGMDAKKE